jgi:hypothetical protein
MSNLLRNKCCDNCPDYDPCEDCGEIKCPENSGTCCPAPQMFSAGKVVHWVFANYAYYRGNTTTAKAVPASELFGGGTGGTLYYRKSQTFKWSGLKYSDKQYPVCCRGGVVDKYEEGFRRCPQHWAWYYESCTVEDHIYPERSRSTSDIRFTGYISNPCTCETLINNDALANGAFSPSISLEGSPLGGKTFFASRGSWIVLHS